MNVTRSVPVPAAAITRGVGRVAHRSQVCVVVRARPRAGRARCQQRSPVDGEADTGQVNVFPGVDVQRLAVIDHAER